MVEQLEASRGPGLCFFDRAIPDIIAYMHHAGLQVPDRYLQYAAAGRWYDPQVFIAPPWKDIYVNDEVWPESFETSEALYRALVTTHRWLRFFLVTLPRTTVDLRVNHVFEYIGKTPVTGNDAGSQ